MNDQVTIRSLTESDVPSMHKAFLAAFSDYPLDFSMNEDMFRKKFVEKLNLNFDLSGGAFAGSQMVGFIFTSVNNYKNKLTAYNGGTGVTPEFRGRNLTVKMYRRLIKKFMQQHIEQGVLEAITTNKPAIRAYEKVGFYKSNLYRCFRLDLTKFNEVRVNPQAVITIKNSPDWDLYKAFGDQEPAFLDQNDLLTRNMANEMLIEASLDGVCVGYCIYQKDIGRISQISVSKEYRRKGVGSALLKYIVKNAFVRSVTVLNVDNTNYALKKFLKKSGFTNRVDQYEMTLNLLL